MTGADGIVVSPDGLNVYVASFSGIANFERVPATGRLVYRRFDATPLPGITARHGHRAERPERLRNQHRPVAPIHARRRDRGTHSFERKKRYHGRAGYVSLALSSDGNDLFAAGSISIDHVHVLSDGTLGDQRGSRTGQYSDVAVGPNGTVYASRAGGVDAFTYTADGLTFVGTGMAPNSSNPANATAVTVAPNGARCSRRSTSTACPRIAADAVSAAQLHQGQQPERRRLRRRAVRQRERKSSLHRPAGRRCRGQSH